MESKAVFFFVVIHCWLTELCVFFFSGWKIPRVPFFFTKKMGCVFLGPRLGPFDFVHIYLSKMKWVGPHQMLLLHFNATSADSTAKVKNLETLKRPDLVFSFISFYLYVFHERFMLLSSSVARFFPKLHRAIVCNNKLPHIEQTAGKKNPEQQSSNHQNGYFDVGHRSGEAVVGEESRFSSGHY